MANKDMITLYDLIYKHYEYHQDTIEGNIDHETINLSYKRWSKHCVITVIRPDYIKIELPNKADAQPVDHYADYKIHKGLWLICGDYGKNIDEYYWCRNRLQTHIKELICKVKCSGPYLLHVIKL